MVLILIDQVLKRFIKYPVVKLVVPELDADWSVSVFSPARGAFRKSIVR